MMNGEGEPIPSQEEIGESEKVAFKTKVTSLIGSAKNSKPGAFSVEATYGKGESIIVLGMPEPEGEFDGLINNIEAFVTTPFDTPTGNRLLREQKYLLDLNTSSPGYAEKIVETDESGKPVIAFTDENPADRKAADVQLGDMEAALGSKIFTQERYQEISSLLNSLTPEDER